MTIRRMLRGTAPELSKADSTFENSILRTMANPRLTSTQKTEQLALFAKEAQNDFQKETAKAYLTFASVLLSGETNGPEVFDFTTTEPPTAEKFHVVLTRAQLTMFTKSLARTYDLEK